MLFCTSLLALVGAADNPQSSPRKLQIVNTKVRRHCAFVYARFVALPLTLHLPNQRQSLICELLFPSTILAAKLNRKTLVIVLEVEIYIYDIANMRLLHVIETTPNPEGTSRLPPCPRTIGTRTCARGTVRSLIRCDTCVVPFWSLWR